MKGICLCSALLLAFGLHAQQKVIPLYPGAVPGSENWNWDEAVNDSNAFGTKVVYNVSRPSLTVFLPDPTKANGMAIVICPGGGFVVLSINREGFDEASWLAQRGVTVFVLKYRLIHSLTNDPVKEMLANQRNPEWEQKVNALIPLCVADGRAAVAYVRQHAAEYRISPNRIGILGFSAGGTVAGSSAYQYTSENKPDFVGLLYPYLPPSLQSEIRSDAPPLFLCAASDDQLGLAPHSVDLYTKWTGSKHSAEMHLYAHGGHGFGSRVQHLPVDGWIDRYGDWLDAQGLMKAKH
jgi:acetyl esterase/lipase